MSACSEGKAAVRRYVAVHEARSWRSSLSSSSSVVVVVAHREGRRMSIRRSAPEMGGPARSRQRHGCPSSRTAQQHSSVGGAGLKGATAALHGIISRSSAPR